MADKKKENQAEQPEKTEQAAEVKKDGKTVRAFFNEPLWCDLGALQQGQTYEIPESRFAVWEKASICTKAKD